MAKTKNTRLSINKKHGEIFSDANIDSIIEAACSLPKSREKLKHRLENAAFACSRHVQAPIDQKNQRKTEDKKLKKFVKNLDEIMRTIVPHGATDADGINLYDVLCTRINEVASYNEEAQDRIMMCLTSSPIPIPGFCIGEIGGYDYQPERIIKHVHECIKMLCVCLEDKYFASIPIGFVEDIDQQEQKNDKVFDFYVKELCGIWEDVFQKKVTTSVILTDLNNESGGTYKSSGRFINFIQACCKPLRIKKSNEGIFKAVKKAEKFRKKEKSAREAMIERRYEWRDRLLALQFQGE